jgi:NAD(P)-dependent dehydrogenase (short-subunit alcohol dehydrogenase family)
MRHEEPGHQHEVLAVWLYRRTPGAASSWPTRRKHPAESTARASQGTAGSSEKAGRVDTLSNPLDQRLLNVNLMCEPIEIARTALFLCSDEATHVNGAVIAVDGGMSAC